MSGTSGPVTISPRLDPLTAAPAAMPRRLAPNHAETSPIPGTFPPAPPTPARKRPTRAPSKLGRSPVSIIPNAVTNSAAEITTRGPYRAARRPANTAASM